MKHGGWSVMVCGIIYWRSLGPLIVLKVEITAEHYRTIPADHFHHLLGLYYLVNLLCSKLTTPLFTRLTVDMGT